MHIYLMTLSLGVYSIQEAWFGICLNPLAFYSKNKDLSDVIAIKNPHDPRSILIRQLIATENQYVLTKNLGLVEVPRGYIYCEELIMRSLVLGRVIWSH